MNILVVIPPYVLGGENKAVVPKKAMLPIGPLVVAGQLRDRGHRVEAVDLVFEEKWWLAFQKSAPDILLLSCHTIRNIPSFRRKVLRVRDMSVDAYLDAFLLSGK